MKIEVGSVVFSKAGRDQGKAFVVVQILDEDYVLLSDGSYRKIQQPKKKKLKHVAKTNHTVELRLKEYETDLDNLNAQIRKALKQFS